MSMLRTSLTGAILAGFTLFPVLEQVMTIAELIAQANATVIDEHKIEALQQRMLAVEEKYNQDSQAAAAHNEFMSRTYSL